MSEPDREHISAALVLLIGDMSDAELANTLLKTFGPRVIVLNPMQHKVLQLEVEYAALRFRGVLDQLAEPPLGKLACDNLGNDLKTLALTFDKLGNYLGSRK